MILQRLVEYYDRLAEDPNGDIAPFGFSRQRVSFEVVLNPNGSLSAFQDARLEDGGRLVPRWMVVPGQAKPPGSGINPGWLWDNAQYMLGFKPEDPNPERTRRAYQAFRDRHLALESEIGDEAFSAVCRFLRQWTPEQAASHPELADLAVAFGVFRLAGKREFVHDRPKVKAHWLSHITAQADAPQAPSLISGDVQAIARLHEPKIKGVRGAQSSGATLVAFNDDAYESYGKSQSFNAPVGIEDAFKYCTALNRLTTNRDRQVHLGDTTVVYWSEKATGFEDDLADFFGGPLAIKTDPEDGVTVTHLRAFFDRLRRAATGGAFENGDVPFYVLGLSPNAARVSVRFWLAGTVQRFAERLGRHLADLEIVGPDAGPPITLRRLVRETARAKNGWPDDSTLSPLLSGALLRSVLGGMPYPSAVLSRVIERIRAEGFACSDVNSQSHRHDWRQAMHRRAAMLKAYLVRNEGKEIDVSLNPDGPECYQIGRLFAVLERIQTDALGRELNRTIRDGHMSAASATPGTVFPRLLRLTQHHYAKLPTTRAEAAERRVWMKQTAESRVGEICDRIAKFPPHLPLDEQGLFFIGYYHQRQAFFTSTKADNENSLNSNKEE